MRIWTWIEEIRPEGSNLKEIVWRLPSLHGHSSGPRGPIDLDSFSRASAYQALGAGYLNFWKIAFRTRVMAVWKWIHKKCEKRSLDPPPSHWFVTFVKKKGFLFLKASLMLHGHGNTTNTTLVVSVEPKELFAKLSVLPLKFTIDYYWLTRPGVYKVKPKGWFKYSLQIDWGVVWDCSTNFLVYMGDLHLVHPALNFSILDAGILIIEIFFDFLLLWFDENFWTYFIHKYEEDLSS